MQARKVRVVISVNRAGRVRLHGGVDDQQRLHRMHYTANALHAGRAPDENCNGLYHVGPQMRRGAAVRMRSFPPLDQFQTYEAVAFEIWPETALNPLQLPPHLPTHVKTNLRNYGYRALLRASIQQVIGVDRIALRRTSSSSR